MDYDLYFNGHLLSEIGAVVTEYPKYPVSQRDLTFTSIPCKSGDVITDNKREKNVPLTYKIAHVPTFSDHTETTFIYALNEIFQTSNGYVILRDTLNPGYFRRAVCTSVSNVTVEAPGYVKAAINFNCDPHLYSDAGTRAVYYSSDNGAISSTITNPEKWDSEPVITLTGSGDFSCTIGSASFTLTGVSGKIIIDKQREKVFDGSGNRCDNKLSAQYLPELVPGDNTVSVTGSGDFSLSIVPNWRRK